MKTLGYLERRELRVLYFRPEKAMSKTLGKIKGLELLEVGETDWAPGAESGAVSLLDYIVAKIAEKERFDIILHNNLLESVPDSPLEVVRAMDRLLTPNGLHIFTVISKGAYTDDSAGFPLDEDERAKRFGHRNRYRLFGTADFPRALIDMRKQIVPNFPFDKRFAPADLERWRIQDCGGKDIANSSVYFFVNSKIDELSDGDA